MTNEMLRETLRELEDQATGLDPARVIAGAKRRRVRRRAAVCAASVGLVAVTIAGFALGGTFNPAREGTPPVAQQPNNAMPSASIPPHPDDVVVDGIRYRASYAGERLNAVRIGTSGQTSIEFTATITAGTMFRSLCTSPSAHFLAITVDGFDIVNGRGKTAQTCAPRAVAGPSERQAFSTYDSLFLMPPSDTYGKPVRIRAFLVDAKGKTGAYAALVTSPGARIALGIYDRDNLRQVGKYQIPTLTEYQCVPYRLRDVRTIKRLKAASIQLSTPGGTPFLIAFGHDHTAAIAYPGQGIRLTGLDKPRSSEAGGVNIVPQPARAASTVQATALTGAHPDKADGAGVAILALYLPA